MKTQTLIPLAAAAGLALGCGLASAQQQGVSKDEIRIGTIQDLSGPLAGFGKQSRNGMQLAVDELNEQGSVQGRKLKLFVEDSGYDPKKAVLAAQKLVNQEKIFIMAGHIGTAQNMAAMPVQFEKNIVNFMPITAAREMYEPLHRLKYSVRRHLLRPDPQAAAEDDQGEGTPRRSAPSTRTTTSAWRCSAAPRPA
jgi:branched-chain amino acid transport system substrate-binding protein